MATNNKQLSNAELKAALETATQERNAFHAIANEAATNLLTIEAKFSPLLEKKPSIWNIITKFEQYLALVKEVIQLIQSFKVKYINKDTPISEQNNDIAK